MMLWFRRLIVAVETLATVSREQHAMTRQQFAWQKQAIDEQASLGAQMALWVKQWDERVAALEKAYRLRDDQWRELFARCDETHQQLLRDAGIEPKQAARIQ